MTDETAYRWFFRRSPAFLGSINRQGRFVDASDSWLDRLRYSRAELVGRPPQEILTPESARLASEEYLPTFRRIGRLSGVPLSWIAADGEVVEVLMDTLAKRDSQGTIQQSLSVFSELKDAARIERHYRDLYRRTPAMLYSVDPEGYLLTASDVFLAALGYARDEMIGRSITDFMTETSRRRYDRELNGRAFETGRLDGEALDFVTRTGQVIEGAAAARADCDGCRRPLRVLGVVQDVTARNRAEAERASALTEVSRLNEELAMERNYLREEVATRLRFGEIIGDSPALQGALAKIVAVAGTDTTVLIEGESGTGKELFSRVLHKQSRRADAPLVKVNCASVPHELFESEFFGHVRGSFTGAVRDRTGRFELARGGTILLDEVGEIPLTLQAKLLRVLQEKTFERVGDERTRSVDVRVVAATNRDLGEEVRAGRFREDLFYRLSVFPVSVPPLRERGNDVVTLAKHFLETFARELARPTLSLSQRQAEDLRRYPWPGNVRELQNVVERALILSNEARLRLDIGRDRGVVRERGAAPEAAARPTAAASLDDPMTADDLKRLERDAMLDALERSNWKISGAQGAAYRFGLKPSTFSYRMKAIGIRARPQQRTVAASSDGSLG